MIRLRFLSAAALLTAVAAPVLADPGSGLRERGREVDALRDRARRTVHHNLDRAANDLGHQLARVRALSPLATLSRGYAVLQDAEGHVVTSIGQVGTDQAVQVRVADGRIGAVVTDVTGLAGLQATGTDPTPQAAPEENDA